MSIFIPDPFHRLGNKALGAGVKDSRAVDLVVVDQVIFSEPQAVPEPLPVPIALLGVAVARLIRHHWKNR